MASSRRPPLDDNDQGDLVPRAPDAAEGAAVAFARGLHTEMLATNQNLITRAQVLLSLNGVVLGVVGAGVTGDLQDLRAAFELFAWWMWVLLSIAGLMLIASIGCCAMTMSSVHWRRPGALRAEPPAIDESNPASIDPEYMWFFRDVARYESTPAVFIARGEQLQQADEVRARLRQALNMAPNVRARALWVNTGYALLAGGLTCFALLVASYLARLAG